MNTNQHQQIVEEYYHLSRNRLSENEEARLDELLKLAEKDHDISFLFNEVDEIIFKEQGLLDGEQKQNYEALKARVKEEFDKIISGTVPIINWKNLAQLSLTIAALALATTAVASVFDYPQKTWLPKIAGLLDWGTAPTNGGGGGQEELGSKSVASLWNHPPSYGWPGTLVSPYAEQIGEENQGDEGCLTPGFTMTSPPPGILTKTALRTPLLSGKSCARDEDLLLLDVPAEIALNPLDLDIEKLGTTGTTPTTVAVTSASTRAVVPEPSTLGLIALLPIAGLSLRRFSPKGDNRRSQNTPKTKGTMLGELLLQEKLITAEQIQSTLKQHPNLSADSMDLLYICFLLIKLLHSRQPVPPEG